MRNGGDHGQVDVSGKCDELLTLKGASQRFEAIRKNARNRQNPKALPENIAMHRKHGAHSLHESGGEQAYENRIRNYVENEAVYIDRKKIVEK